MPIENTHMLGFMLINGLILATSWWILMRNVNFRVGIPCCQRDFRWIDALFTAIDTRTNCERCGHAVDEMRFGQTDLLVPYVSSSRFILNPSLRVASVDKRLGLVKIDRHLNLRIGCKTGRLFGAGCSPDWRHWDEYARQYN